MPINNGGYYSFYEKITEVSPLKTAIDQFGGAGDVYVGFRITPYPTQRPFQEWERVGEALYEAMRTFDG